MNETYLQDPFTLYRNYVAIKTHFTYPKYDFVKYNGHMPNATRASLNNRSDWLMFSWLATRIDESQNIPFLVSQFVARDNISIADITNDRLETMKIYNSWCTRMETIWQSYSNDILYISKHYKTWKDVLITDGVNHPNVMRILKMKKITPETYAILDMLFNFSKHNNNVLKDDEIYQMMSLKYTKYQSFLPISLEKIIKHTPVQLG